MPDSITPARTMNTGFNFSYINLKGVIAPVLSTFLGRLKLGACTVSIYHASYCLVCW